MITISLLGPAGELLQQFTYSDDAPWPTAADGGGRSLEYIGPWDQDAADPSVGAGDPYDDSSNWRASLTIGGSPGDDGNPAGDFDGNGSVDEGDYLRWKADFGMVVAPGTGSDGNANGHVDASDYTVWRNNLEIGGGQASLNREMDSPATESEGGAAAFDRGGIFVTMTRSSEPFCATERSERDAADVAHPRPVAQRLAQ